jgi:hypothetical protein
MVGMREKNKASTKKKKKKKFMYGGKANPSLGGTIRNYFKEPKLVK